MMIRCNKVEKVDFEEGQNMAENSDKIIFVTAGGKDNGNVRTEIRQEIDGAIRKITASSKECQKPRTNQFSDAKIQGNLGSEKSKKILQKSKKEHG